VTLLPPPTVPWQITGNHWMALPCIHPADASLHAIGVLHRGSRSAIEFAGSAEFITGGGAPLLRPTIEIAGQQHEISSVSVAWERALGWIPTFTCTVGDVLVRGTIFAPYGRDADVSGAVYALTLEHRGAGKEDLDAVVRFSGRCGYRQLRVRTARPFADRMIATRGSSGAVLLHGEEVPGLAALAISTDGDGEVATHGDAFTLARRVVIPKGGRAQLAVYIAVGPERDGAEATAGVLRRRGWRELLATTRDALRALEQSTGDATIDRLINRNLLFSYFYAVGRALDDAQYYLVRSRVPWNGRGVTCRDWDALMWTLQAVQLADPGLARELLLRVCELHGYAPGRGVHYMDGTLFEPGFALEGVAAYAIATDRYIRDTGDDRVVDEPALAETLYASAEDMHARRNSRVPLYSTEVDPSGAPVAHAYTLHANATAAQAFEILRRTLDEETAQSVDDPEGVRAAITRHFVVEGAGEGKSVYAAAVNLAGAVAVEDIPSASAIWLPTYETVPRHDSTYRRTVKAASGPAALLVQQCARAVGPQSALVIQWLRRAPLDAGVAAEVVDADGRAVANGGDAALSGLVAWAVWYAVNALGERP